jgi:hypothetical protein
LQVLAGVALSDACSETDGTLLRSLIAQVVFVSECDADVKLTGTKMPFVQRRSVRGLSARLFFKVLLHRRLLHKPCRTPNGKKKTASNLKSWRSKFFCDLHRGGEAKKRKKNSSFPRLLFPTRKKSYRVAATIVVLPNALQKMALASSKKSFNHSSGSHVLCRRGSQTLRGCSAGISWHISACLVLFPLT